VTPAIEARLKAIEAFLTFARRRQTEAKAQAKAQLASGTGADIEAESGPNLFDLPSTRRFPGEEEAEFRARVAADLEARENRLDAAYELGTVPVTRFPDNPNHYFIDGRDGLRMFDLLRALHGFATVERFPNGLLVRWQGGEEYWFAYMPRSIQALNPELTPVPAGQNGLPESNVSTVVIVAFRGVRTVDGRPVSTGQLTDAEQQLVDQATQMEPLLYAGHVGISFDGGKTIYGFTPDPKALPRTPDGQINIRETIAQLRQHKAFPGTVEDDTHVFRLAEEMAEQHHWNTRPITAVELLDPETQRAIRMQVAIEHGTDPGALGRGYAWPLLQTENGEHYAPSGSHLACNLANCAKWPERVGVTLPEPSGNLAQYIPELEAWIRLGAKDVRPFAVHPKAKEGPNGK